METDKLYPAPETIKLIDRYEILAVIGMGPVGCVYHAADPDFTGEVALKVFPPGYFRDPALRTKYEQEARVIALLEHPGIVPVLEIGEFNGRLYVVMQRMPGGSLADRIAQGPLELAGAVTVINRAAAVLETVHSTGILHRDLKPENILFDEAGQAYLSDFGMLKLSEFDPAAVLSYLPFSPAYTSPEEALGAAVLDERCDVYSLGAVLYAMLAGKPPFRAGSAAETAAQRLAHPLPSLLDANSDLPDGLQNVIEKAMAADPEERYDSAAEFALALVRCLEQNEEVDLAADLSGEWDETGLEPEEADYPQPDRSFSRFLAWSSALLLLVVFLLAGVLYVPVQAQAISSLRSGLWGALPAPVAAYLPTPAGLPPSAGGLSSSLSPESQVEAHPEAAGLNPVVVEVVLPTETLAPASAAAQPEVTATQTPSATRQAPPTQAPVGPAVGGADQIAFINVNDIWLANLDGSGLERLTADGVEKSQLRWTPDGKSLVFVSDGQVKLLQVDTLEVVSAGRWLDFAVSPDMTNVIIGDMVVFDRQIKRWLNIVRPFNADGLRSFRASRSSSCAFTGGWLTQYAPDGKRIAAVVEASQLGRLAEIIQVFDWQDCGKEPVKVDNFFGIEYPIRGYNGPKDPLKIEDYAWDGRSLFAVTGNILNGFGELVTYNLDDKRYASYSPLGGECCYRDARFSPDGSYIVFAFMNIRYADKVELYYLPAEALAGSEVFEPMPLPGYFFEDRLARIYPALRPVR